MEESTPRGLLRVAHSHIQLSLENLAVFEQSLIRKLRTLISVSLRTLDPFLISRRISEPPAAPLCRDWVMSFQSTVETFLS